MNLKQVIKSNSDELNLLLIVVSAVLAYLLPFSLFLFSYAVLGPLHYITEINWLENKQFFVKKKAWILLFVGVCALICVPVVTSIPIFGLHQWPQVLQNAIQTIVYYSDILLLSLVLLSIALVFLNSNWKILLFFALSLLLSKLIITHVFGSFIVVGLFLPTIIHIYVFTLLFIISGVIKSRSKAGLVNIFALLLMPVLFGILPFDSALYQWLESEYSVAVSQNFRFINAIADFFGVTENGRIESFSLIGLKIQSFVAFAYTYHYLNWFSKVYTIGWSKSISKSKLVFVILLWSASLALFAYDYGIAYLALFFMALLHIVLEFPLNVMSIKQIYAGLFRKLR